MSPENKVGRARLAAASVLIATFVLGALTGAGVAILLGPPRPEGPPPPMPLHALDLSAEQMQQVHELHERYRPELEQVLRETYPRARAIQEKIEKEMRDLLTPAQREKLDQLKPQHPPGPPTKHGGLPPPGPPGPHALPPHGPPPRGPGAPPPGAPPF